MDTYKILHTGLLRTELIILLNTKTPLKTNRLRDSSLSALLNKKTIPKTLIHFSAKLIRSV